MNVRQSALFGYASLRGYSFPRLYGDYFGAAQDDNNPRQGSEQLSALLLHCAKHVPYYKKVMKGIPERYIAAEPQGILTDLPILTKDIIRSNFEELKSDDLSRRHWYFNTSGGSTGVPVRLIQDREYSDAARAVTMLYYRLAGHEEGQSTVFVWGSERDIIKGTTGIRTRISRFLRNWRYINAFRMTADGMRNALADLNRNPPHLIVAYAQSLYELARFADTHKIKVASPSAVMTSAGTLHEFMRTEIAEVFRCPVFNRYGSREVGDIACERPGCPGLWVAPWGTWVEVLDPQGMPLVEEDGDIIVTCLTNRAMPLVRYKIGDRGSLAADRAMSGQVLRRVSGRNVDTFRTRDGTLVDGEYFTHLLYFRDWVKRFQVRQTNYTAILVSIEKSSARVPEKDLREISHGVKAAMGSDCQVRFEFPEEIPPSASGKFRYTISEVQ